uniref:Uncharacterized protein n=1 Tax=Rousettus aegyptiacus TaxID=9407 RepID=A0A7J8H258_ROUAE|nr:hypothetical protein HJG63_011227 [Rousettus aegyptiacus]
MGILIAPASKKGVGHKVAPPIIFQPQQPEEREIDDHLPYILSTESTEHSLCARLFLTTGPFAAHGSPEARGSTITVLFFMHMPKQTHIARSQHSRDLDSRVPKSRGPASCEGLYLLRKSVVFT